MYVYWEASLFNAEHKETATVLDVQLEITRPTIAPDLSSLNTEKRRFFIILLIEVFG